MGKGMQKHMWRINHKFLELIKIMYLEFLFYLMAPTPNTFVTERSLVYILLLHCGFNNSLAFGMLLEVEG